MRNIIRDLEDYEDDNYSTIERFDRRPSFKGEDYRHERKGESIQHKRRQKAREREQMIKNSELDNG